jgi:NAD(P)-dependent dehydrogenase (short-subunit alcohol dehydrogenase family)
MESPKPGCQAAAQRIVPGSGGRTINIASATGIVVVVGLSGYVSARLAVVGLTKSIALELAEGAVSVVVVAPGAVDAPLNMMAWDDGVRATYRRPIGLGRIGTSEEVAEVGAFFAPFASRYIAGQEIVVKGGLTSASCGGSDGCGSS